MIYLDDMQNSLHVEIADNDGFHICEENGNKIYVYYSEITQLEQMLRKVKYDRKNMLSQHSPSSKEKLINESELYKTCGDIKSFPSYAKYIRSDEWEFKRKQRIKKDGGKCKNCGRKFDLEVHHKNYNTLGNEDLSDLITLCKECHDKTTKNARRRRKGIVIA